MKFKENIKFMMDAVNWRFLYGFVVFMVFSLISAKFRPWLDIPIEEPFWQNFSLVFMGIALWGAFLFRYAVLKPEYQIGLRDYKKRKKAGGKE